MTKALGERAKHRLRIAAGLLRGTGPKARDLQISREAFYPEIQRLISELPEDQRLKLQEQTDWVEAYENAEKEGKGAQGA